MFISNTLHSRQKIICIMEIHITQDEREELLKSLEEKKEMKKKEMKKRLASELSQFRDCDPATITSIRTWVYSVCPLLSLYKSGAEVIIIFRMTSSTGEQTRVAVDATNRWTGEPLLHIIIISCPGYCVCLQLCAY